MKGALLTRFFNLDYSSYFDQPLYNTVVRVAEESGLARAIDDTRKGLLLLSRWRGLNSSVLWVTGIPSSRKDKLKTPIRYNLVLSDDMESLQNWACFFLWLFQHDDKLNYLGNDFDTLVADNAELAVNSFDAVLSKMNSLRVIENSIEIVFFESNVDYLLFSELAQDNVSLVKEVLAEGVPAGLLWNAGKLQTIPPQKKKPSSLQIVIVVALVSLCATGFFLFYRDSKSQGPAVTASGLTMPKSELKPRLDPPSVLFQMDMTRSEKTHRTYHLTQPAQPMDTDVPKEEMNSPNNTVTPAPLPPVNVTQPDAQNLQIRKKGDQTVKMIWNLKK